MLRRRRKIDDGLLSIDDGLTTESWRRIDDDGQRIEIVEHSLLNRYHIRLERPKFPSAFTHSTTIETIPPEDLNIEFDRKFTTTAPCTRI